MKTIRTPTAKSASISGWILASAVVLFVARLAGIYDAAARIDKDSRLREERLVINGLQLRGGEIRRVLASVSVWDDAVIHLDNHFDPKWADTYVARYFWNTDHYGLVYILDAQGKPIFEWEHGRPAELVGFAALAPATAPMVAAIRRQETARGAIPPGDARVLSSIDASTVVRRGGQVYVLAASLVEPDHTSGAIPSARAPVIVVGQAVDAAFIAAMSRRYLLDDLRVVAPDAATPSGYDQAPLEAAPGDAGFRLAWKRHSPINHLLTIAGPPLAAVFLALALAPLFIIRGERRNRALSVASEDARQASEAKSAFLATISHEIRTPLNGILGTAQAIVNDELPPKQRDRVDLIYTSGMALLAILNDVLDLSKIESGKLELECEPFELDDLLGGARTAFTALTGDKALNLNLSIAEDARGVYDGDILRLRQILLNLISNAVKFTEAGAVGVIVDNLGDQVRIAVHDTGRGIAPDRLGNLFERFVQEDSSTTRRYGGTGLGLAICRELCAAMGGTISVDSAVGEGSTFTVVLPLTRSTTEIKPGAEPAQAHRAVELDRPLRVLAAEDNAVNQLVLKTLLEQAGIEPVIVGDGAAAVEAWASGDWDLILMDVQMPVMDGPTASRTIRALEAKARRGRTPIVALTANVMSHQIQDYEEAGMDGCVAKPIQVSALYGAINDALVQSAERSAAAA